MAEFIYEKPVQLEKDTTKYKLLTKDYVKVVEEGGRKILTIDPKGLEILAKKAVSDISFSSGLLILKNLLRSLPIPKQQIMTVL